MRAWVYPRVCGGTPIDFSPYPSLYGLSPRVRGNLTQLRAVAHDQGSIPACAGEPAAVSQCRRREQVYPRVCGGTCGGWGNQGRYGGLSPRVRGNQRS